MPRRYKSYSQKEIPHHLKKQANSNLSITAYCKKHNLVYQTFCGWKKETQQVAPNFIKIELPASHHKPLEIKLPNGIQARLDSEDQIILIKKLMQVLHA